MSRLDRRRFLKQSLAASAVSSIAIGRGGAAPANEKVNMAFIGINALLAPAPRKAWEEFYTL